MATGEGKTLAVALAAAGAALAGVPVHVITANDYLVDARRADAAARSTRALGLTRRRGDAGPDHAEQRRAALRAATSPTAPPRSWCSTTCATAWAAPATRCAGASAARRGAAPGAAAARPVHGDRRRGRQHPDRRGAGAADPLPAGRRRAARAPSRQSLAGGPRAAPRRGLSPRTGRAGGNASARPARAPRRRSGRARPGLAQPPAPRGNGRLPRWPRCTSTSATATTWCATARCTSSTRPPAASPPAAPGRAACSS